MLALCCGVAQWPCLSAALLGGEGGQEPPAELATQDVGAAVGGMAAANAALAVRPNPQPPTAKPSICTAAPCPTVRLVVTDCANAGG